MFVFHAVFLMILFTLAHGIKKKEIFVHVQLPSRHFDDVFNKKSVMKGTFGGQPWKISQKPPLPSQNGNIQRIGLYLAKTSPVQVIGKINDHFHTLKML